MNVFYRSPTPLCGVLVASVMLLGGCGGGSSGSSQSVSGAPVSSAVTMFTLQPGDNVGQAALQVATPAFHVAPIILSAPGNIDAQDNGASARALPAVQSVPEAFQNVSSRRLTLERLQSIRHDIVPSIDNADGPTSKPMSASAVMTYTPAQIRAAYGMPALPATGAAVSAAQAAAMGAGQTIYIIDAMNDPNSAAELAAFNQSFGLPACTTVAISKTASLPLPAASGSACQFSVVYSTASGGMSSTAPAYDSGWATEIALDVQWTHATAPLARIVLIEAPDATNTSLVAAITLANSMGPGAVSMSFGAAEGNWTTSLDGTFSAAKMTYLAATGDSGAGVQWPAVSSHVLAVGGTSLTYNGSGSRTETAWSDTGGGISAYVAAPSYQTGSVPGLGSPSFRAVADVSFNADPNTGQYLAVISPGSSSVSWLSAGGTSLATPQWAGIVTIANAQRALASKAALGSVQSVLYSQIALSASNYATAFLDVKMGSDGSCASCSARAGYDEATGLGTPNVAGLLTQLGGTAGNPPVVTPAAIAGVAGVPLTFTVAVTAPDVVTYSLSGQPSGMTISSSGVVSWSAPLFGTYSVTVTAKDNVTGLSGSGLYTIAVAKPVAPVVTAQSISGTAGKALSFTPAIIAQDAVTYSLSGQPTGMSISTLGVVSWATPVANNYSVTVTAKDSKTGLSGSGIYAVAIAAAPPPAVTGANITGTVGTALSFAVAASAVDPVTYTLSNAPPGMAISSAGLVSWARPVAGTYAVTVVAKDNVTALIGSAIFNIKVSTAGLNVVAPAMTGKVGKILIGTISITDTTGTWVNVSISSVPMGVSFVPNGLTITATWAAPVQGNYIMKVTVVDSAGFSTELNVPITVSAS